MSLFRNSRTVALFGAATLGLFAFGAVARSQTVTNIGSNAGSPTGSIVEGTVYEYLAGTPNTCCHGPGGGGTLTEIPRETSFGPGTLNDQLYGSQADLDAGLYRGGIGGYAYQSKGIPDPNFITETDPVYFSGGAVTVQFNLPGGVTASQLSDIVIEDSSNPRIDFGQYASVAITDSIGDTINYTGFGPASDGSATVGLYETDVIPMAGTNFSGSSITLAFPSNNNQWGVLDEIDFYAPASVPEPASLGLLAVGALGLLSRRRRLA